MVQAGPGSVYIPLYGSPLDMYIGGAVSKDPKLKSSYGFGIRFGEVITPENDYLREIGVYKPSTKYDDNKRALEIRDFLDGVSVGVGGCAGIICGNKVNTIPKANEPIQHGFEYGIGVGGSKIDFGGGVTRTPSDIIKDLEK